MRVQRYEKSRAKQRKLVSFFANRGCSTIKQPLFDDQTGAVSFANTGFLRMFYSLSFCGSLENFPLAITFLPPSSDLV